jgi:hypothetical protein
MTILNLPRNRAKALDKKPKRIGVVGRFLRYIVQVPTSLGVD